MIDTSRGQLLGTISGNSPVTGLDTPLHAKDVQFSPDGARVYRFIFGGRADATGPSPLRIIGYDAATGDQTGDLTLSGVQSGTWLAPQSGGTEQTVYFQGPGVAIAPDSSQIAVISPDGTAVTLIDATKLAVERTVTLSRPSGQSSGS